MIAAIIATLCGFGSLFLGGAIGRANARGDRLAAGQVTIGWLCLVIVSILSYLVTVE